MALLTDLMEHSLDRSYQDRADARVARGEPAASGGRSPLLVISCVVLGLLLVVAAQTLRVSEESASGERTKIIGQIEGQQKSSAKTRRQIAGLRSEIKGLRSRAVGEPGTSALAARLARTETTAGAVAVTGPGVVITLDDRDGAADQAGSDPRGDGAEQKVLASADLQIIVNGLWQSGAEAISINGNRLTSLSAIRFAGQAILVDFRPLTRPYTITAIGKPGGLWPTFRDGSGGAYLEATKRVLGLDVRVENEERVNVPASDSVALHKASPAPKSPSPTSSREEKTP